MVCSLNGCLRTSGDLSSDGDRDLKERGQAGEQIGAQLGGYQPCEDVESSGCDDDDPCTVDGHTVDPVTCAVTCVHDLIEVCGETDRCCPNGCNALDDPDCSSCGDGVIDDGETCDGDCPEQCDDGDPCTTDLLIGNANTCNARCDHVAVDECGPLDACCPQRCDQLNDGDCAPRCGDEVIDEGETCDGDCPTTCDDGTACTLDQMTGSPDQCDAMCSHSTILECISGDGCCPFICDHTNDSDCPFRCVGDHRCAPQPPEGWTGMGVLNVNDEVSGCAEAFSAFEPQLYRNPRYNGADCSCTCGRLSVDCGSIEVSSSSPTMCSGYGHQSFEPNQCTRIQSVNGSCGRGRWMNQPRNPSCPSSAMVNISPISWSAVVNLCTATFDGDAACQAQEVCVPTDLPEDFVGMCVYRSGLHSCPSDFPMNMTGYTEYNDTRSCSPCACNPRGVSCSTTLRSYSNRICTVLASSNATALIDSTGFLDHNAITFTSGLSTYLKADTPTVSGVCTPSGGVARGAVETVGAHTICCEGGAE